MPLRRRVDFNCLQPELSDIILELTAQYGSVYVNTSGIYLRDIISLYKTWLISMWKSKVKV
jgi:hypothetical protein